jgi:AcrR family transcriptional regulator
MQTLPKGERTRLQIIEVATDLIFETGFYNITLAQIAKAIGITQQAIYKHFDSMDAIIIEACLHWVNEAQVYIDSHGRDLASTPEQLRSMVEANMRYSHRNRKKDALLLGLYYYALSSPHAMTAYRAIKNGGIHRIHRLIVQGNRELCWQAKDPLEKAWTVHSILVGEIIKMIVEPQEKKLDARIEWVNREIMTVLSPLSKT